MKTRHIICFFMLIACSSSCSDFLDRQPLDRYNDIALWSDPNMMEQFLNNIYNAAPGHHGNTRPNFGAYTDEMQMNPGSEQGQTNINNGQISASSLGAFGSRSGTNTMTWDNVYKTIRSCNLFLDQSGQNTYPDQEFLERMRGEVYFHRAYNYHYLAFLYGGVPIIKHPFGLNDSTKVSRNTFAETIEQIVSDCDSAALLLPAKGQYASEDEGRATKGAAMALKARVLLYAASDLYHTTGWTGSYAHPELVSYVNADRQLLWRSAQKAAKDLIDLQAYELHKATPAQGDYVPSNYHDVFISKLTEEDIYIRFHSQTNPNNLILYDAPSGYRGWTNTCPLAQLIDDYEMADGSDFSWDNPAHRAHPYENRDPRFYASILFNGAEWRPRPDDLAAADPVGIINTTLHEQADGSWVGGMDSRTGSAASWEGTYTGYNLRKFMDPTVVAPNGIQECSWRYIRYAEILLAYAEASAELAEYGEAREYLNKIRTRAGMPPVTETGPSLLQSIRKERRIELMGEGHRFFDIRRWMIAPEVMNVDELGVEIRYYRDREIPEYKTYTIQNRKWADHFYFLPILISEMNKNNKLIQNPLY